jgi:uncharacterized membrane protein
MENIVNILKKWQLHPVADHFSMALLVVAVLVDLAVLVFSQRLWLRYTALTLMVMGAVAAAASYATGDLEGDRVWDMVGGKAKDVLKLHAQYGYYLMYVFAALALWRILIQAFAFMERTRQIYLAFAVLAVAVLIYQGSLGGELVYTYGVGTGAMAAGAQKAVAAETPQAAESTATSVPTSIPTVYVPAAEPTASAVPSATGARPPASASPTTAPKKPAEAHPGKSAAPSAKPSAQPSV